MPENNQNTFTLPVRSEKPRRKGLTSIIDYGPDNMGWTGEHGIADLLDCAASYIDFAKIYAMNALLIPSATLKRIIARYRNAEITCYSGGILFEYAYLKNEIDGLLKHLLGLGFNAMEISENYVTLGDEERRRLIGLCQTNGLSVIYEFGRKNPDDPISLDQLGSLITATLELGVKHIILEQSEITFTASHAPGILQKLASQPWFDSVLIEADPFRFPEQHVGLLRDFGNAVSLANVAPGQALRLEGLRRGIGRAVDYALLRQ